jgi:hypothetical protein
VLAPYLLDEEHQPQGFLIYNVLNAFKDVKSAVFGTELANNYEEVMKDFKIHLDLAHLASLLPITPKLHIIAEHILQWVEMTGESLAKSNEAAVEAAHHVWWEVWKHYKVFMVG